MAACQSPVDSQARLAELGGGMNDMEEAVARSAQLAAGELVRERHIQPAK